MEQSYFCDYRQHLTTYDLEKKPADFCNVVWFNFGKGEKLHNGKLKLLDHKDEVWVRHSYDVKELPQRVSYFKKRRRQSGIEGNTPPLYHQFPIPIKQAKADDLKKLVASYVPTEYQDFYSELPCCNDGNSADEF